MMLGHTPYILVISLVQCTVSRGGSIRSTSGNDTILEAAAKNGCGKVVKLVEKAGLSPFVERLNGVTFFAPNDAAIETAAHHLPKDVLHNNSLVHDILRFHFTIGFMRLQDFNNDQLLHTLLPNSTLRMNVYTLPEQAMNLVTAGGNIIKTHDIPAANGFVQVLDKIIYPLPTLTIPVEMTFAKDLTNMAYLILQAGLIDQLEVQNLTIFAPSNEAIKKIPAQIYENLLQNKTLLTSVVSAHIVPSTVYTAGMWDGQQLKTLTGNQLKVTGPPTLPNGYTINGAKLLSVNLSASNGVIHVIDTIFLPPSTST